MQRGRFRRRSRPFRCQCSGIAIRCLNLEASTLDTHPKIFGRGLAYHEIAIVKRMRLMEYTRDYIFSFLLRPGRKLTPACISEIDQGKIGCEVEAATPDEVRRFVDAKMQEAAATSGVEFYGPLSSFRISQELGWFTRAQGDLLRDESQRVEFKLGFPSRMEKLATYAKTMAAFANNRGGYIFFGITDERRAVGIPPATYKQFDWDGLAVSCREYFQPDFSWERSLVEWQGVSLGVIFVNEAKRKPIVSAKPGPSFRAGEIFYRYKGHTSNIEYGDLLGMLSERDQQVRDGRQG